MAISITAAEREILQQVNIPPRPETLLKVSAENKKEDPNIAAIAAAISADLSISAAVLQVVNSAAFRRARQIESVQQAVMTLGLKRVYPIVRAVALKAAMGEHAELSNFWLYAEKVAEYSARIARALERGHLTDHAYMLGLFQGSGIPVLLDFYPDYSDILAKQKSTSWQVLQAEELQRYRTSHTTVGALLAQKWALPKIMVEVIYYSHEYEGIFTSGELGQQGADLLGILKIARYLTDRMFRPEPGEEEWAAIRDEVIEHFQLDDMQFNDIVALLDADDAQNE